MPENTNPTHLDLFSGIQSEGSLSQLNGQDSEPSHSASETNGAIGYCKKTLETSQSSTTSEISTEQNSQGLLFSQGDFLASHSLVPASDEARRMTASSGQRCSALYRKQSQLGSLVRTLLESSIWNSKIVVLTWKPKVTKSSRLLFQLAPSTPRTDETGFGLSPDGQTTFHTPNTNGLDGGSNNRRALEKKMWPTPDASQRGARSQELVVNQSTVKRRESGQIRGMDLQTAVKMWPTPTAHTSKETNAPSESNRNSPTIASRVGGQLNPQFVEYLMNYPKDWTKVD